MTFPKNEKIKVFDELDKLHNKSVELGFNGVISPQFYKKLKKVKKVRLYLKIELIIMVGISICSIIANGLTDDLITSMVYLSLMIIMCYGIIKNLKIWIEIKDIKQQRFKEYYEKNNIST